MVRYYRHEGFDGLDLNSLGGNSVRGNSSHTTALWITRNERFLSRETVDKLCMNRPRRIQFSVRFYIPG